MDKCFSGLFPTWPRNLRVCGSQNCTGHWKRDAGHTLGVNDREVKTGGTTVVFHGEEVAFQTQRALCLAGGEGLA